MARRPATAAPRFPAEGVVRIFLERAGRGGKVVTVRHRGRVAERLRALGHTVKLAGGPAT